MRVHRVAPDCWRGPGGRPGNAARGHGGSLGCAQGGHGDPALGGSERVNSVALPCSSPVLRTRPTPRRVEGLAAPLRRGGISARCSGSPAAHRCALPPTRAGQPACLRCARRLAGARVLAHSDRGRRPGHTRRASSGDDPARALASRAARSTGSIDTGTHRCARAGHTGSSAGGADPERASVVITMVAPTCPLAAPRADRVFSIRGAA